MERGRDPEAIRRRTGFSIGYPGWNLIYYLVLSHFQEGKPAHIIETGTNLGATTAILAQGLVDTGAASPLVHTFEIDAGNVVKARAFVRRAGLEEVVRFSVGDVHKILRPELAAHIQHGECRLAFLDASHLLKDVEFEFESVLPYLSKDGIVVFDNTYPIAGPEEDPRVAGFLKNLVATHGGNLIELPFVSWYTPGVALWQRNSPWQD
jgi:predicted O-methyltransferase YrrM